MYEYLALLFKAGLRTPLRGLMAETLFTTFIISPEMRMGIPLPHYYFLRILSEPTPCVNARARS